MAEAPGRVFSQLRSQKVFTVSKKGEEDIWEEEEDKVASLEAYFQTAKAEAVVYAANPMLPCLIHSGTGQVHAWVHWYQSWALGKWHASIVATIGHRFEGNKLPSCHIIA